MGRKNVILPFPLIEAGDMSDDFTSAPETVLYQDNISLQVNWSGTGLDGSYSIEASNYDLNNPNVIPKWTPLVLSGTTSITADTDTGGDFINIVGFPGNVLRFVYTATTGVGTMRVMLVSKVVGA